MGPPPLERHAVRATRKCGVRSADCGTPSPPREERDGERRPFTHALASREPLPKQAPYRTTKKRATAVSLSWGRGIKGEGEQFLPKGRIHFSATHSPFVILHSFVIRHSSFVILLLSFATRLIASDPIPAVTAATPQTTVLLVVGAPGEAEYGTNFLRQAALWTDACAKAGAQLLTVGLDSASTETDLEKLRNTITNQPTAGPNQLWIVLIGHGTFDNKEARFNLRGPDLSATDLAMWLQPFKRPLAIIDTSSSSAPFLNKLSGPNRVVITATRSGHEQNFARFGQYFAEALTDPGADLDKDDQVSLLEAFLSASRRTAEFYKVEARLATEHALLDDNGDGLGTPADWFHGLRATKRAKENAALDGPLARQFILIPSTTEKSLSPDQRAQADSIEKAISKLRDRKSQMTEDEYYQELETLLLQMARLYHPESTSTPTPAEKKVSRNEASRRDAGN